MIGGDNDIGGSLIMRSANFKNFFDFFHERLGSGQRGPLRITGNPACNSGNVGSQPKEFSTRFQNRDVFLLEDETPAGVDNQIFLTSERLTHLRFEPAEMIPPELLNNLRNGLSGLLDDFLIGGDDLSS